MWCYKDLQANGKEAMVLAHKVTKLVKCSPQREEIFLSQKAANADNSGTGLWVLCPTRWTVRANSLASIQSNYAILQDTCVEALGVAKDTETKARIIGVQAQMQRSLA